MNKEEREEIAKQHTSKMNEQYSSEIAQSIQNSIIYEGKFNSIIYPMQKTYKTEIIVEDLTTEAAIAKCGDGCCALNFASFTRAGGGFIKGSIAQEEAICHVSNLYNILKEFQPYYDDNYNFKMYKGLYKDWGIFTPNVIFLDKIKANIITVAAPNYKSYIAKSSDMALYNASLKSRIKFVLDMAQANKQEILILGAFGCGVFGNKPEIVAKMFMQCIESKDYNFKKIIFAVPCLNDDKNYQAFKNVIEKR